MDWDLTLLTRNHHRGAFRQQQDYPYGLRRHRVFPRDDLYYGAIVIDLILRFTWLTRLSPNLDRINSFESGIFLLVFLEVARRWMWIFFRVETEWGKLFVLPSILFQILFFHGNKINRGKSSILVRTSRGPAPDDVLLGELGKYDDD